MKLVVVVKVRWSFVTVHFVTDGHCALAQYKNLHQSASYKKIDDGCLKEIKHFISAPVTIDFTNAKTLQKSADKILTTAVLGEGKMSENLLFRLLVSYILSCLLGKSHFQREENSSVLKVRSAKKTWAFFFFSFIPHPLH